MFFLQVSKNMLPSIPDLLRVKRQGHSYYQESCNNFFVGLLLNSVFKYELCHIIICRYLVNLRCTVQISSYKHETISNQGACRSRLLNNGVHI